MVPLLLIIVGFVFILGQYGANDLAMSMTLRVNDGAFDAQIHEAMREKLDLSDPVLVRFGRFIAKAARGDFGVSYTLPGHARDRADDREVPAHLSPVGVRGHGHLRGIRHPAGGSGGYAAE